MNTKRISIVIGVLLGILIAILGISYYMDKQLEKRELAVIRQFNEAQTLHHNGKTTESIAAHQALLDTIKDLTLIYRVKSKLAIAADYFNRGQEGDLDRSLAIYKEILMDEGYTPFQRAATLNELLDIYQGTHDEHMTVNSIFAGAPLDKYLKEADGDLGLAIRLAYEYGYSIRPTPIAAFRIAEWYGTALQGTKKGSPERELNLSKLKEWITKGEVEMKSIDSFGYETSRVGYMYQMDAMSNSILASWTDKDFRRSEELYKRALEVLGGEESAHIHEYTIELFVRFHYGALVARYFDAKRWADVKEIISPMYDPKRQFTNTRTYFDDFLKSEVDPHHKLHQHRDDLIKLSQIDPKFKAYLDAKGLKYQ